MVVPASAGLKNHYNIPLFALADEDRGALRLIHGLSTAEKVRGFRGALLATLKADAASWADDDTVILSSEHLIHLQDSAEFDRLKEVLAAMGPRPVRIVIYLRRQDAYYVSAYAQHVRGGSTAAWMSPESFDHLVLDYQVLLDRWESAFGRERICVRVFERGQLTGNDAVADFMSFVGCPLAGAVNVERNVSLGARETEFLRRLNPLFPRFIDDRFNEQRRSLVQALTSISNGPPLRLDSKCALEILARYRDSNAAIAAKYLGRTDGQLFHEVPGDAPEQPPALSVDEAVDLSARLWAFAHEKAPKPTGESRKVRKAERMARMTLEQRRALRQARQARGVAP
ncbi:hypothetical protein [Reyranella sp.]|uniref:hypothetical protein n=1 Tax=Reyranella sp. TaxID=1929291 RepID=UPI003C7C4E74